MASAQAYWSSVNEASSEEEHRELKYVSSVLSMVQEIFQTLMFLVQQLFEEFQLAGFHFYSVNLFDPLLKQEIL